MKIGRIELHNPIEVLCNLSGDSFFLGFSLIIAILVLSVCLLAALFYIVGFYTLIILPVLRILYAIFKGA